MSGAAAAAGEEYISEADADVDPVTGVAEDVFLSLPYDRDIELAGSTNTHTYYAIIVLTHSKTDAKNVTGSLLSSDTKAKTIRIVKPKYPSWMFGNKQQVVVQQLFGTEFDDAAKGFSQSVFEYGGDDLNEPRNKRYVDVHFPNPMHPTVQRLKESHLLLFSSAPPSCLVCLLKRALELPNVVIYEAQEVKYTKTFLNVSRGVEDEADISDCE